MQKCYSHLTVSQGRHFIIAPSTKLKTRFPTFSKEEQILFLRRLVVPLFTSQADSGVTGRASMDTSPSSGWELATSSFMPGPNKVGMKVTRKMRQYMSSLAMA